MKFKHFETESGNKIKTAQFDGYSIAERLLEGLMFQVNIQEDGTLKVYVNPEDESFLEEFNSSKWLESAKKFAEENDIFEDPISGEDCWLVSDKEPKEDDIVAPKALIPIKIKASSFKDTIKESTPSPTKEELEDPKIGEFKTKDKFIQFVGAKGDINFISNEAFIEGKYLSGLGLDDVKFKLTICDEGTVDFEEVDTQQTTKEQRKRLLDIISEKTIVPSRNRMMIVNELPFFSVKPINGKQINLYLAVDYIKPIDKLASLIDDEEISISDEQASKIDDILSLFHDVDDMETKEVEKEEQPCQETAVTIKNDWMEKMEDSFSLMKKNKIEELNKSLEDKKKDLNKSNYELKTLQNKISKMESDIKLLESRLETLTPAAELTGFYFNVSERMNEKIQLQPDISEIIKSTVSKVKGINAEAFMKLFENGEYHIRLGEMSDSSVEEIQPDNLPEEIKKTLTNIGINLIDDKLTYVGPLNWGDIVNKMVKSGFQQDSDFDKKCGSNSYNSKTEVI